MTMHSINFCSPKARRALPAALCSLLLLGSMAQAAEGFYVLGSVGSARLDDDTDKSRKDAIAADVFEFTPDHSTQDDNDTGSKLQLGYQFNDNFAIEGGYTDLGQLDYKATSDEGWAKQKTTVKGWNLDALLILPVNAGVSLFAKIGAIDAEVKTKVSGDTDFVSGEDSDKETKVAAKFGLGLSYNFYGNLSARIEGEYYSKLGDEDKTGEVDAQLYSVGLSYRF